MQFPTDTDLIKHFLHTVLDPKSAICESSSFCRCAARALLLTPADACAVDFDMSDDKDEKVDVEDVKVSLKNLPVVCYKFPAARSLAFALARR
jgi:hypothetical protein